MTASNFTRTGTTATIGTPTTANGGLYWSVPLSGGNLASLNGTVGLNLANRTGVTDLAGNVLATITFTLWGPDNPTCDPSGLPFWFQEQQNVNGTGTQSFTTANSGDPVTGGIRLTSASPTGVWHWSVDYSGDEANIANHRVCTEAFDFEGITDAAAG